MLIKLLYWLTWHSVSYVVIYLFHCWLSVCHRHACIYEVVYCGGMECTTICYPTTKYRYWSSDEFKFKTEFCWMRFSETGNISLRMTLSLDTLMLVFGTRTMMYGLNYLDVSKLHLSFGIKAKLFEKRRFTPNNKLFWCLNMNEHVHLIFLLDQFIKIVSGSVHYWTIFGWLLFSSLIDLSSFLYCFCPESIDAVCLNANIANSATTAKTQCVKKNKYNQIKSTYLP